MLRVVARFILWVTRWRIDIPTEPPKRAVFVVAPHTSYWDALILLPAAEVARIDPHWMGTHNLFRFPFRPLMRWFGGIPVDRTRRNGLVASAVAAFSEVDHLQLALAPEGTRFLAERWKTGFYRIAEGAGVPLVLVFIDYRRRVLGIGDTFMPSGDIEADMARIRDFYADVTPKRPEWFAPPSI